ncbi:MAG TPA: YcnI family protein [Terrimesophilobacter sp.]|nr:YcnI family protein [Terrimesophilobacter sp.]
MNTHSKTRIALAIGAGILLALAAPLAASAHVTVSPGAATAGSYALLTVKVPNESATAGTSKLELSIPAATPFASVSYVPVPGWTTQLVRTTLPTPATVNGAEITEAVTSVIWTAEPGHEISAGQLQAFQLSVGPVPDTDTIALAAVQTYTDGRVVNWNESGEKAEHPAPVLTVGDAPAASGHGAAITPVAEVSPDGDTGDLLARGLGLGGLVLGAIALVLAIAKRRTAES